MAQGLCFRGAWDGVSGVTEFMISALLYLAMLYPLYKIGVLGAGDVKLLAVLEGCFPRNQGIYYFLAVWIVAAIMAFAQMLMRRDFLERMEYLLVYLKDVARLGKWQFYFQDRKEAFQRGSYVHMTIPMLIALPVYLGGFY